MHRISPLNGDARLPSPKPIFENERRSEKEISEALRLKEKRYVAVRRGLSINSSLVILLWRCSAVVSARRIVLPTS